MSAGKINCKLLFNFMNYIQWTNSRYLVPGKRCPAHSLQCPGSEYPPDRGPVITLADVIVQRRHVQLLLMPFMYYELIIHDKDHS